MKFMIVFLNHLFITPQFRDYLNFSLVLKFFCGKFKIFSEFKLIFYRKIKLERDTFYEWYLLSQN